MTLLSHHSYPPRTNARSYLTEKIQRFLIQSEQDGFDWGWADTCCIDKTSSAELTEAINSMFYYYSHSEICYAYLSDVHSDCDANSWSFQESRWHKRGWTLQELIAPKHVVFVREDWYRLGTKYELAYTLQRVFNMPPASVLRFEEDISDMSIAQRMSWAARRDTTRVEDEAYCLFGLFDVNMPTLYGEGRNAFYRLQEALMNTSPDTSIFAWSVVGEDVLYNGLARLPVHQTAGGAPTVLSAGWPGLIHRGSNYPIHMLAPSPHYFACMTNIISSVVQGDRHIESVVSDDVSTSQLYY